MRYDSDSDDTIFTDDNHMDQSPGSQPVGNADDSKREQKPDNNWKNVAVGTGAGAVIGGISPFLMGMAPADSETPSDDPTNLSILSHPELVDDKIKVATNVEESMNFSEAFATARAEVGPGGCFEWHGNIYSTYLADEWNAMSPEEKVEFNSHFSWNHNDHSVSHVKPHVSVETPHAQETHDLPEENGVESHTIEVIEATTSDPEIEILGISHDAESGSNVGSVVVDGQEIILIDVDGDMDFDYMALNSANGETPDVDNLVDIQGHNLSINDLGGIDGFSDSSGFDGFADYSNDNC